MRVKQKRMKKSILVTSLIVAILACSLQSYRMSRSFDAAVEEFNHSVSVALYTVADSMSENVSVEKRSSNYFYVTTNSPLSPQKVDTMVRKELAARNIVLDYELGVYKAEDDSLVYGNLVKAKNWDSRKSAHGAIDDTNKNFAILFSSGKNQRFGQMDIGMLVVSLLIASLISWAVFFKDHGRSPTGEHHQIQLGNSLLDFHNQNLIVNELTYSLTHKENQLLKLFFKNPNQVIDRDVFLTEIWEKDGFFVARSMDVFVSKVRKYLRADEKIKIENIRSKGYRLLVSK